MEITRVSIISGIKRTRDIDCTEEQMQAFIEGQDLVQNIFPKLSDDDREFILSGIVPEEWDEAFLEKPYD